MIPEKLIKLNMSYFCESCDKKIKLKSKSKGFKSRTHKEYEKLVQLNHTTQNPNFFDVDKVFNDFITNQTKNLNYIL